METKDVLIVIDMQNDFIDLNVLGSKEAEVIVPKVAARVNAYLAEGKKVIYTKDTHFDNYLNTKEGKYLPIPHCIKGTEGWNIPAEIYPDDTCPIVEKQTFGSLMLSSYIHELEPYTEHIEVCGLCTDICVVTNVLLLNTLLPNAHFYVQSDLCAGTSPIKHEAALDVMTSCQVEVIHND